MRSETPPMWATYLIALGIMLIAVAVIYLVTGKIKLKRDSYVVREEEPGKFWAIIGGCFAVALIVLAIATPHFGPGG
jgi:uncharacterized membrane protein YidH (DUF202 family)